MSYFNTITYDVELYTISVRARTGMIPYVTVQYHLDELKYFIVTEVE